MQRRLSNAKAYQYARMLSICLGTGLFLIAIALCADLLWRAHNQDQPARQWAAALDITAPVFWPAGTPQRHPETLSPAVDLRMVPWLPTPAVGNYPSIRAGTSNLRSPDR